MRICVPIGQEIPGILFFKGKHYEVLERESVEIGVVIEHQALPANFATIAMMDEYTLTVRETRFD